MRYIPNTDADCKRMLQAIGVQTVEDLLADIPQKVRVKGDMKLPSPLSESELLRHMRGLAEKDADVDRYTSYLGAGAYNHFAPSVVNHLILRGEFFTAYTPYQPEVSQGTLQAIYEYQTLICQLTGMEVANASMYDAGSATAEAALMAHRINSREEVLISRAVHPEYRQVVETYTSRLGMRMVEVPFDRSGATDLKQAKGLLTNKTSCLILQNPNFFGVVEDLETFAKPAHDKDALVVVAVAEPISLGILRPPGEAGADIVAGEGQALGNGLSFGGPYLGFFASREVYLRSMPGRLVGQTEDREGRRGYVLTLSTREQHIRREKATSNICTNEGLCALAAAIFMVTMGRRGLREMALLNLQKARFTREKVSKVRGFGLKFGGPTFNEFVVVSKRRAPQEVNRALLKRGIIGGLPLARFYPELRDCLLCCVTEQISREEIERLCKALGGGR
ncbi:MAG: aminomethyl-transferring glycine dehydrogenase subunit GcvPA [Candidatus Methylomirabilales bacterium]